MDATPPRATKTICKFFMAGTCNRDNYPWVHPQTPKESKQHRKADAAAGPKVSPKPVMDVVKTMPPLDLPPSDSMSGLNTNRSSSSTCELGAVARMFSALERCRAFESQ